MAKKTDMERFWDKVSPEPNSGCWLWIGSYDDRPGKGYGFFTLGKLMGAHRASWLMFRGPIPQSLFVLHKCDTPPCVNPDHLFLGTHLDNVRDSVTKGRHAAQKPEHSVRMRAVVARGTEHWMAKLSEADIAAIRSARGTQRAVSKRFGISQSSVWRIRRGVSWSHL